MDGTKYKMGTPISYDLTVKVSGFNVTSKGDMNFVYRKLSEYCDSNCSSKHVSIGKIVVIDNNKNVYNFIWDEQDKCWAQPGNKKLNFDSVIKDEAIHEYIGVFGSELPINPRISAKEIIGELKKVLKKYNAKIESDTDIRINVENRIIVVENL